jgi:hypothetical protein
MTARLLVKSIDRTARAMALFGAPKHGYFETAPNTTLSLPRVDDAPGHEDLREARFHTAIAPYASSLPTTPRSTTCMRSRRAVAFGHWVNGGHWSTCEARMMLGYYRLGKYDDARKSMQQILTFARASAWTTT